VKNIKYYTKKQNTLSYRCFALKLVKSALNEKRKPVKQKSKLKYFTVLIEG
jgi:hypothetical protein